MIYHLRTNVRIKMNTKEKEDFKTQGYARELDMSKNTITYFQELENFKEKLDSRGIAISTAEMAKASVKRIFDSHYFPEEKTIRWERQPKADQDNMNLVKRYFTKLYRECLQYLKVSKGTTRFNKSTKKGMKSLNQEMTKM